MNALPMLLSLADDLDHSLALESPFTYWYDRPSLTRRWPSMWDLAHINKELSKIKSPIGKDGFQVSINVENFKPNELQVKVVDDHVVVEAKHEERSDNHGYISRHIKRRYAIPKGYDPNKVASSLSSAF